MWVSLSAIAYFLPSHEILKILARLKTMQIQNKNLAKNILINVALIILSITLVGCASRQTEIIIPASPDKIWAQ